MNNIKGLILDVDGVLVGEKIGLNSPWPNKSVIKVLKQVKKSSVFVSLLTAKPHYSINKIIIDAGLDNLHIADSGAVIIDPINNKIAQKQIIDSGDSKEVIETLLSNNVYTEIYTVNEYLIQKDKLSDITKIHTHILQREPVVVKDLAVESINYEITKIMPISLDEMDKKRISEILNKHEDKFKVSWGVHPIALPCLFGIITKNGVSKKEGAIKISKATGISLENVLAVGDSASDWQFMELCGYAAAMGNAQDDLKNSVISKASSHSYIGKSVDENGIIDILKHFSLI